MIVVQLNALICLQIYRDNDTIWICTLQETCYMRKTFIQDYSGGGCRVSSFNSQRIVHFEVFEREVGRPTLSYTCVPLSSTSDELANVLVNSICWLEVEFPRRELINWLLVPLSHGFDINGLNVPLLVRSLQRELSKIGSSKYRGIMVNIPRHFTVQCFYHEEFENGLLIQQEESRRCHFKFKGGWRRSKLRCPFYNSRCRRRSMLWCSSSDNRWVLDWYSPTRHHRNLNLVMGFFWNGWVVEWWTRIFSSSFLQPFSSKSLRVCNP